jgi:hypothetical protein
VRLLDFLFPARRLRAFFARRERFRGKLQELLRISEREEGEGV